MRKISPGQLDTMRGRMGGRAVSNMPTRRAAVAFLLFCIGCTLVIRAVFPSRATLSTAAVPSIPSAVRGAQRPNRAAAKVGQEGPSELVAGGGVTPLLAGPGSGSALGNDVTPHNADNLLGHGAVRPTVPEVEQPLDQAGPAAQAPAAPVPAAPSPKPSIRPSPPPYVQPVCAPGTGLHPAVSKAVELGWRPAPADGAPVGSGQAVGTAVQRSPADSVMQRMLDVLQQWRLYPLLHSPLSSLNLVNQLSLARSTKSLSSTLSTAARQKAETARLAQGGLVHGRGAAVADGEEEARVRPVRTQTDASADVPRSMRQSLTGKAWRGEDVDVRHDVTSSISQPLPNGYGRASRTEQDVQKRREWHQTCLGVPKRRGDSDLAQQAAMAKAGITAHYADGSNIDSSSNGQKANKGRGGGMTLDRRILEHHGYFMNSLVQSWLQRRAQTLGLTDLNPWGFPTAEAPFYKGPWIEDHWLATFMRPVKKAVAYDPDVHTAQSQTRGSLQVLDPETGQPFPPGTTIQPYTDPETGEQLVDVLAPYDAELFHPYVPLFIPWENINTYLSLREAGATSTPLDGLNALCELGDLLKGQMMPNVMYVTVTQRPMGPWLLGEEASVQCRQFFTEALQNTLVLSAGGTGHVPIPLLAQERPFLQCSGNGRGERSHSIAFIGSPSSDSRKGALEALSGGPWGISSLVLKSSDITTKLATNETAVREQLIQWGIDPGQLDLGMYEDDVPPHARRGASNYLWMRAMAGAQYTYAPRGAGPTSFRLYEALQMGLLPIYVHDGTPWLPYLKRGANPAWVPGVPESLQSLWARISFVVHQDNLPSFFGQPQAWNDEDAIRHARSVLASAAGPQGSHLDRMRIVAAAVRDRYFTYDGVVRRIAEFLDDPFTAELDCQASAAV